MPMIVNTPIKKQVITVWLSDILVFESPSVAIEKGYSNSSCQTKERNKTFYDIIYNLKTVLNISKYKIFMSVMEYYYHLKRILKYLKIISKVENAK